MTVEYLLYTTETSMVPPDILLRHNVVVVVANTRVAKDWIKKSQKAGARGVYHLNYRIADNAAQRADLSLRFESTRQDCYEAKNMGSRGIIPFYIGLDTW